MTRMYVDQSTNSCVMPWLLCDEISILISEHTLTDFGSAGRSCKPSVPADFESTFNPSSRPIEGANPSAIGERQMFPVHIINRLIMILQAKIG